MIFADLYGVDEPGHPSDYPLFSYFRLQGGLNVKNAASYRVAA